MAMIDEQEAFDFGRPLHELSDAEVEAMYRDDPVVVDTCDSPEPLEFSDPAPACPHREWARIPDPQGETDVSAAEAEQCVACGMVRRRRKPASDRLGPHPHEVAITEVHALAMEVTYSSTTLGARLPCRDRLGAVYVGRARLLRVHADLAAAVVALKTLERHVARLARS